MADFVTRETDARTAALAAADDAFEEQLAAARSLSDEMTAEQGRMRDISDRMLPAIRFERQDEVLRLEQERMEVWGRIVALQPRLDAANAQLAALVHVQRPTSA